MVPPYEKRKLQKLPGDIDQQIASFAPRARKWRLEIGRETQLFSARLQSASSVAAVAYDAFR